MPYNVSYSQVSYAKDLSLRYLRQVNINVNVSLILQFFFLPLSLSPFTFARLYRDQGSECTWSKVKEQGKYATSSRSSDPRSSPLVPDQILRSTSHPIGKFPVGKGLPLFPSRGRFTLIQVTPPRRVALIDGFEFSTTTRADASLPTASKKA